MSNEIRSIAREVSDRLLQLDVAFHEWLGKPALQAEARLLMLLNCRGAMSVKEAMHHSPISHRAFYMMLERLKQAGIVYLEPDHNDARVRRIHLSEHSVENCHKMIRPLHNSD